MERVTDYLKSRQEKDLLRTLQPAKWRRGGKCFRDGVEYYDMSCNDYLGLSGHPELREAAVEAAEMYGVGAGASRLLSGDTELFHELERVTAEFKNKPAAIVFNSGYQANTGMMSCLADEKTAVFADKLSHASIIDGVKLSGSRIYRFRHNDAGHLETLLKKKGGKFETKLIATESVFSMDGDIAPLKELVEIKKRYGCFLFVDEAHATGIYGKNGSGMAEEAAVSEDVDVLMGTFSKALGSFGAYAACSEAMKTYFVNACRSFIYSTALPPSVVAANIKAIDIAGRELFRRNALLGNACKFRELLAAAGLEVKGESQIVSVLMGEARKALLVSDYLKSRGFWAMAVRPPTVRPGEARVRFSLSYDHGEDVLDDLAEVMRGCDV